MATYMELRQLFNDSDLQDKMEVAVIVAANAISAEAESTPNHTNRLLWAQRAYQNPKTAAEPMLRVLLAANTGMSPDQIRAVTDAQLQAAVDAAVNTFAT